MFSKLIHAIECISTLLLFIVEEELIVWMYHFVFIHRETTFKDHLPCVNIVLKLNERKIQVSTVTNAHRCPQSLARFLFFTRKNISAEFSHRIIWLCVSVTSRVWWCKRSPVPGSDDHVEFWFCYWANQGSSLRLSFSSAKWGDSNTCSLFLVKIVEGWNNICGNIFQCQVLLCLHIFCYDTWW